MITPCLVGLVDIGFSMDFLLVIEVDKILREILYLYRGERPLKNACLVFS